MTDSAEARRAALLMSAAVIPRPSEDAATSTAAVETDDGWMSMNQLREFCGGVSRASVYRWIRLDILPLPVQLGPGKVFFSRREVRESLARRPRSVIRKSPVRRNEDQAA
jgi:predicted DNA-binding transcriptional regulator AlpA